jgi:hypothetical protein
MPQRRNSGSDSGDIAKALLDERDVPVLLIHETVTYDAFHLPSRR